LCGEKGSPVKETRKHKRMFHHRNYRSLTSDVIVRQFTDSMQQLKRQKLTPATFTDTPVTLVNDLHSELLQGSPSSAKVMNAWRYSSTSSFVSMTWYFTKHVDFAFFFLPF
jgi:predicted acyl esterase